MISDRNHPFLKIYFYNQLLIINFTTEIKLYNNYEKSKTIYEF